jgi:hemolysin activation/secretion protein
LILGNNKYLLQGRSCLLPSLISLILVVPPVIAAEVERLPGVVDRPTPELPDVERRPAEVPIPAAPSGEEVADPNKTLIDNLTEVMFSGISVLDEPALQQVVAPFLNKSLSAAGLAELKYAITRTYYDQGYVLVKVTTPPQDVSDGVLEVVIYEAQIGSIDIMDNDAISPYLLLQISKRVESGDVFREGPVESMVNDANDLAGVSATVNLRPGAQVGTTDMALIVEPANDDVQRFTIDNYSSELTGKYVGMGQLQKSNLFGWGETLRFIGRKSDGDLWSVLFGVTAPIGLRNIMLDVDYLHSENEIGDRLSALDASGESSYFGISMHSAIINQRAQKLNVRFGFEARRGESFLAGVTESKTDTRQFFLEGNYLWNWPNTVGYASVRFTKGVDIFGASDENDPLISRPGADPQGFKVQPLLYLGHRLSENDFLKALFVAQWSNDPLLPGDLFVAGGYGTVRGFEPGEESGERGILMNLEYQRKIYQRDIWSVLFGPFLDVGKVDNEIDTDSNAPDDTLIGAGLGLEVSTTPSLWNYGNSNLRFDWAHQIGDYDSTFDDGDRFYFRFTQTF